jgi:isoamyl acetate esterase
MKSTATGDTDVVPTSLVASPIPLRGKVSAKWSGIAELMRSDSPMAKGLEAILELVDLDGLCSIASGLRNGLDCYVTDKYTCGGYNIVFEIVFEDGLSWIARLRSASPMQVVSQEFVFESPTYKQHVMESEVATMNYVREHTNIPVPQVYAFELSSDNPVKLPYILMECIHGWRAPLKLQDLSKPALIKVLDELAGVVVQLSTLQFPQIGYLQEGADGKVFIDAMVDRSGKRFGPLTSAAAYYKWRGQQPLIRSNNSAVDLHEAYYHSHLYKLTLPFLMDGFRTEGPFPLSHNDLGVHNMLFDENWKLKAVIDWTGACIVPWESFAQFPGGVNMGPYLRHEFSDQMYHFYRLEKRIFLDAIKRHEDERKRDPAFVPVSRLLGTPVAELAACIEQYDYAFLRKQYQRKMCRLLFGPDVDVELMKLSISKSELFGDIRARAYQNGGEGKSSDLEHRNGLCIGGTRNGQQ